MRFDYGVRRVRVPYASDDLFQKFFRERGEPSQPRPSSRNVDEEEGNGSGGGGGGGGGGGDDLQEEAVKEQSFSCKWQWDVASLDEFRSLLAGPGLTLESATTVGEPSLPSLLPFTPPPLLTFYMFYYTLSKSTSRS